MLIASDCSCRFALCLIGALILSCTSAAKAVAQTLPQLRNEVRVNDPEPVSTPDRNNGRDRDDYCDDDSCDGDGYTLEEIGALTFLTGLTVTAPFWVPIGLTDDSPSRVGRFPAFPYQYDIGYMLIHPDEYSGIRGPTVPFDWAVRARSDYGTNFSGLDWVAGNLMLETSSRFGLESDFRFYQDSSVPVQDSAWLGDANIFYRFAQSERVQVRSGLGINWFSDRLHIDVGFNCTYAGDLYPIQPWVISGEFDWRVLGDEMLLHARVTSGLQYKGLEAYVGYDFIDIGKFQSNSLIAGLRLWF